MLATQVSALVILVPEAEALVKPFRDQYDPSAAEGVPAHITVLVPFKPPAELPAVLTTLADLFARCPSFTFTLAQAHRFPEVLYLAPRPDQPFKHLTRLVAERFPENPPYGGVFPEVIPHLTVALAAGAARLDAIAAEFERAARPHVPVVARAAEVVLIDNEHGAWQTRARFRLGTVAAQPVTDNQSATGENGPSRPGGTTAGP